MTTNFRAFVALLVFLFLSLCAVLLVGYCLVRLTDDPSVLNGLAELVRAVGSLAPLPGHS